MSSLLVFLIGFPFGVGLMLLVLRGRARAAVVMGAAGVVAASAVTAALCFGNGAPRFFGVPLAVDVGLAVFWGELAVGLLVCGLAARHRRFDALALGLAQVGLSLWLELSHRLPRPEPERLFGVDRLSMIMFLIIGLIGPLICVHAVGFMRDYHRHFPRVRGRRSVFFFLLFAFLSAMFGLVSANDLPLMHLFWELTTLSSFLLIGYTRTPQTITFAFNALSVNLLGGLGFSVAMALLATSPTGLDLARLCARPVSAEVMPAVALLALAGLTKSAQMPFSSWLLGAMHAPTPTSALLHSSTMVKAGVFLLLKLSFAMSQSLVGTTVALVGLLTFVFVSVVAMTEPNAKRVLALSTIANLGLVVGCAGIGTPATIWVGVMIVIFHAAAKSLLFLVVGSLENRLYTKELERFDNLLWRFPRLSLLLLSGVTGMFIVPFGLVVAKWAAMRALLDVAGWRGAVYLLALAYGSAATIFYWSKLLAKLLASRRVEGAELAIEHRVSGFEWLAEGAHAVLVLALTFGVSLLSEHVVAPLAFDALAATPRPLLHVGPLVLAFLTVAVLALPALALGFYRRSDYRLADVYLCGRSATEGHVGATADGGRAAVSLRNYYLTGVINGPAVFRWGTAVCAMLVAAMVLVPGVSS